jgi:hypothetical protein
MVVLKHLARTVNRSPFWVRKQLREKFGTRRRWRWSEETDKDYQRCLSYIQSLTSKVKS